MAILDRISISLTPRSDPHPWYFAIPAIAALRQAPLELTGSTVIVGDNGSGKSTLLEAMADTWLRTALTGAQVAHWSPRVGVEDSDLRWELVLAGERPAPQGGCFVRAEAMYPLFTALDAQDATGRAFGGALTTRSHGEGFLAYLQSRTTERGLFLLDEPEAALSFTSCLQLLSLLDALVRAGNQVVLATHSPVLAALPGAQILQFDETGITRSTWEDLELVAHWQAFLGNPQLYLRHLLGE
ncbi:MAG: ATP-binding protein [Jatrophihabitans sp.]